MTTLANIFNSRDEKSTYIIAEIGQNHQGDIEIAKKLIKTAKDCGANCAKFQKTSLTDKFTKAALSRKYDGENSWGKTYGEHKAHLEFSEQQFRELQRYANEIGIAFTASAMDIASLKFLIDIDVPFIKIGSGDANNVILLEEAAKKHVPLVVSTGMQSFENVKKIYDVIGKFHKNFVLLHCVSAYPTPIEDINLSVINLYKDTFPDVKIGYSGHELGIDVSIAAVALGAKVIERHITLDKTQKGTDHKSSLEPTEFTLMVQKIRLVEQALGLPVKQFQNSEGATYVKLGKTLVAARNISAGHQLQKEDVKVKVADSLGIDPIDFYSIVGKTLKRDVIEDEVLTLANLR